MTLRMLLRLGATLTLFLGTAVASIAVTPSAQAKGGPPPVCNDNYQLNGNSTAVKASGEEFCSNGTDTPLLTQIWQQQPSTGKFVLVAQGIGNATYTCQNDVSHFYESEGSREGTYPCG
jgi:hypothetical protein